MTKSQIVNKKYLLFAMLLFLGLFCLTFLVNEVFASTENCYLDKNSDGEYIISDSCSNTYNDSGKTVYRCLGVPCTDKAPVQIDYCLNYGDSDFNCTNPLTGALINSACTLVVNTGPSYDVMNPSSASQYQLGPYKGLIEEVEDCYYTGDPVPGYCSVCNDTNRLGPTSVLLTSCPFYSEAITQELGSKTTTGFANCDLNYTGGEIYHGAACAAGDLVTMYHNGTLSYRLDNGFDSLRNHYAVFIYQDGTVLQATGAECSSDNMANCAEINSGSICSPAGEWVGQDEYTPIPTNPDFLQYLWSMYGERSYYPTCTLGWFLEKDLQGNVINGVMTSIGCFPRTSSGLAAAVIRIMLGVSGVVALGLAVYAIITIVSQGDNPDKVKESYGNLAKIGIGLAIVILSIVILRLIGIHILALPDFGGGSITNIGG